MAPAGINDRDVIQRVSLRRSALDRRDSRPRPVIEHASRDRVAPDTVDLWKLPRPGPLENVGVVVTSHTVVERLWTHTKNVAVDDLTVLAIDVVQRSGQGIRNAELEPLGEAAAEHDLHSVVARGSGIFRVDNIRIADVGPKLLRRNTVVGRIQRRAERDGVQISLLQQMSSECADIRNIEHRLESDLLLHAQAHIGHRRNVAIALESARSRWKVEPAAAEQILDGAKLDGRIQLQGWVFVGVDVEVVALAQVVEDAEPSTNGHGPTATRIKRKAQSRRSGHASDVAQALGISKIQRCIDRSVQGVPRTRNDGSNCR